MDSYNYLGANQTREEYNPLPKMESSIFRQSAAMVPLCVGTNVFIVFITDTLKISRGCTTVYMV